MNYTITNPKGIDEQIQRIQTDLHNKLNWGDIEVFGRARRNQSKNKGLVPEAYLGNGEYREVYNNDRFNATIFFIDDTEHNASGGGWYTAETKIVFSVNLPKIKSNISHRADMEAEIMALKIIEKHKIFEITGFEKGVETVLRDFDTDRIKLTDMQPFHVFAIVGTLKYKINC